ncbi:MAG: DUF3805 domain-containing protein [Bacteroides sp.]|uniref:DUF3805 domain-containing protein n=1 Tax=Bacteroides sp. TaxID=29523 RepID=UPI001B6B67CD|nr:DUF3805 domain-containing protein [Bacteroides sp.]MBP6065549.1 DUF3805 domain-containing protein [Bacteroides sp.]MBP6067623.1 DUF3805 domain-containing protein [Bacteroides sp.]MBP8622569.1 DUF3805 domain-containing protein [Bacteroides sp.]
MAQGKKFISPQAWFSMTYPIDWNEFEDGEGTFLFFNPDVWTGNFRISAYKEEASKRGSANYGQEAVAQEFRQNDSASMVKVGPHNCAYSKEMFEDGDTYYTQHTWIIGIENMAFECSFTVPKGADVKEAEAVIASLAIRHDGQKYPAELIPIRLSEIALVDEGYEWTVNLVKSELAKDFQGVEDDLTNIQQLIDKGVIGAKKKDNWLAIGITICVILANEVEGMEWMTLIDGNREAPVLHYKETEKVIDPLRLVWSKIKAGETCNVEEAYKNALV